MQKERPGRTRGSSESLASGCTGPYSPIEGLSALQTVTPSLAIAMPKVERLNRREFPKSCPESGTSCTGPVENFFHFTGKLNLTKIFQRGGKKNTYLFLFFFFFST